MYRANAFLGFGTQEKDSGNHLQIEKTWDSVTDRPDFWNYVFFYLNAIMTEEQSGIGCRGHRQTCSSAPHRRLPFKECEGEALTALVTLTKYI